MNRDDEIEYLGRWKDEALVVISAWGEVWEAAGQPGQLGESIATATRDEVLRMRAENEELKHRISDACEVLREARNIADAESYDEEIAIVDALLRRLENP